ncbi:hypothetical protein WHR41_07338 [Cladosporium halotolerans]|uniref:Uncharacterized protein n=1 Tax=Cladosporium halotolerans TaxID=1052096 RepID=A0AB34KG82_9PEZI
MSFDIDEGDREHYYRQYGTPDKRWPALRRSRMIYWTAVAAATLLVLYFLTRPREPAVDWHHFAYSLYATDAHSLCNALLVFDSLKRLGSRADRVLLYPKQWDTFVASNTDRTSQLLNIARDHYKVNLLPIGLLGQDGATTPGDLDTESSWDSSITKLRAFELTPYNRVLQLDADLTLLKNLDHLFLLPSAPVAMPRAYWADVPSPDPNQSQPWPLTSLLLLLEPNRAEFKVLLETLTSWRTDPNVTTHGDGKKYDMDLLNYRYGSSALVLPQRPYALLTAEFRNKDHTPYLGPHAHWDAQKALEEAALVHFSDWPLPKPWTMWSADALAEIQPKCTDEKGECVERKIWKGLYEDFRVKRRDICKILSVPAPIWTKWKADHGAS